MDDQKSKRLPMQRKTKPKVEDVAKEILDKDKQKNVLEFVEFLKDNKLTPKWASYDSWKVTYKSKGVCFIKMNQQDEFWTIAPSQLTSSEWFANCDKYITDAELKEFVLDNISGPRCTIRDCKGRQNITILGKKFDEVCNCWPIVFKNPTGETLENSKKLILVIKKFITDLVATSKI